MSSASRIGLVTAVVSASIVSAATAQTIAPAFAGNYTWASLGSVPGVPASYGGLNFMPADPNTLIIAGSAAGSGGALYRIGLTRDAQNNITGFSGSAALHASAPNADGGVEFEPASGVLLSTTWPTNRLYEYRTGSTSPDRTIELTALGVSTSTGSIRIVPPGFAGAGRLKIISYSASAWYDAELVPDGTGLFDVSIASLLPVALSGGPEGAVYIANTNPQFASNSVLVSEYNTGSVAAYEIDSNSDPVPASRRVFMTGISGAEGAAIDPLTGHFLFSTYGGGNRVIVVRGFTPPPSCPCDTNNDGVLNSQDFFDFLTLFFSSDPRADFNADGVVNSQDFFDFLACFFTPPAACL